MNNFKFYFIMIAIVGLINILSLLCTGILAADQVTTQCGRACHPLHPEKTNVHLVAHTHDDVGWLKSADQYYYGSNKGHAPFGVQYILDSVISELEKNRDRRFVYVETSFFWSWWEDLGDADKEIVRRLVTEGRFEFLHGGWCMSDEATPHYSAMIDQMTLGLRFLNETFGECGRPTVSWQIDPFGHSSEVAIEFAEMGFNGLFVGRIDFEDYKTRRESKTLESIWRPDPSLADAGDLFTSVLFDLYMPPSGFCFDTYCSDDPIMDNKKLHGYNVDEKIKKFEEHMDNYQRAYKTKNVLVTMGGDFHYTSAPSWFKNLDKLIKYTNSKKNSSIHLLYSTPNCYLNALNEANTTWPVKESDDYFPYGSDEHSYWTGYFTSRPTFKYFVYLANNLLQATKQVATLLKSKFTDEEFDFKRAVSIVQHHDGVSGTEKQHVADDYAVYMQEGINIGQTIFSESYKQLYGKDYPEQIFGNLRNISQFKLSEDHEHFVVTVYNPLSRKKTVPIKFPFIKDNHYQVYNRYGAPIQSDFVPLPSNLHKVAGRNSNATHDLVFIAKDIPPLGVANFYVQASQAAPAGFDSQPEQRPVNNSVVVLDNGRIQLNFNKTDGLLMSFTKNGTTIPFHQNFYSYSPMKGYNYNAENRASGAYIFRPTADGPKMEFHNASITEYRGTNIFEIHQKFAPWLSQIVRLYKNSEDIEFEWLVGPLPIIEWMGMEFVTKYSTDIASNATFYTDSNGRRWVKRIRNHRKYWTAPTKEPIASNYYPLTTSINIKDNVKQLTVITDRPEGGTSMKDGEVEIMLHRRLLYDDNKGVGESLDEIAFGEGLIVRGTHVVQIYDVAAAPDVHRLRAIETAHHPVPTFAKATIDLFEWMSKFNKSFSFLIDELPPNVHVLTLERWRPNEILLRLEHIFESTETSSYAKPATINLKKLLSTFTVNAIEELTLAANLEKEKLKRMKWLYEGQTTKKPEVNSSPDIIVLQPMQIRTFLLKVTPNKLFASI